MLTIWLLLAGTRFIALVLVLGGAAFAYSQTLYRTELRRDLWRVALIVVMLIKIFGGWWCRLFVVGCWLLVGLVWGFSWGGLLGWCEGVYYCFDYFLCCCVDGF